MPADTAFMDKLVALCKRRGFIFQSSEIYGGIGGFWDYGPLGVELKRNIKNAWWQDHVTNPPIGPDGDELQMVGVDCSIIMHPKVWEASGHATGFADPMVACKAEGCKGLFRADKIWIINVLTKKGEVAYDEVKAVASRHNLTGTVEPPDDYYQIRAAVEADSIESAAALTDGALRSVAKDANLEVLKRCSLEYIETDDHWRTIGTGGERFLTFICSILDLDPAQVARERCPRCRTLGSLLPPRAFNLMFESYAGALKEESNKVYLRPETAQGMFANFKNILDTSRVKIPFGIAQVGKAFRNEINPRNYTFRSREFEQMEIEFFCRDEDSMKWYEFWRNHRYQWYVNLGLKSEKLRLRDQGKEELAHYSKACADIEYLFPFSDEHQELEGCAHRGCFDLTQHQTHSGVDLNYFDETGWANFLADRKAKGEPDLTKEQKQEIGGKAPYRFLPTVIEPSAGADRATLAFLCEAYSEDQKPDAKGVMQTRVYMKFHPRLAPIKAAFLPLVNKEGMPEIAEKLYRDAKKHMNVYYDDGGAIGRRYARQDEAGTPFCITIDGDTIKSAGDAGLSAPENAGTVTIRDRDSLKQERVKVEHVVEWLRKRVASGE